MNDARLLFFRLLVCSLVFLSACASYKGSHLQPGVSTLAEVIATMGEPAMRWKEADGSEQLAYPKGPSGTQTYMVFITPDKRLNRINAVLEMEVFAKIIPGQSTQADVLKLLGPPPSHWIYYYKARDELVWEWRFCDAYSLVAFFSVLYDGTTGLVRSTMQRNDFYGRAVPGCARV